MDKRLVKIGDAAKLLGTTPDTLRKWELTGEVLPARKTKGGTRYYDVQELLQLDSGDYPTIGYAPSPQSLQNRTGDGLIAPVFLLII